MSAGKVFTVCLILSILCVFGFATLTRDIMFADLPSFDARIGGYGPDEARDYLRWLEEEGLSALYLGRFTQIDWVFPLALGGMLASAIFGLWARPARMVAQLGGLVCLFYVGVDYLENRAVRGMIRAGAEAVTDVMITDASLMTELKWTALFAALLLIASGLILTFVMRRAR